MPGGVRDCSQATQSTEVTPQKLAPAERRHPSEVRTAASSNCSISSSQRREEAARGHGAACPRVHLESGLGYTWKLSEPQDKGHTHEKFSPGENVVTWAQRREPRILSGRGHLSWTVQAGSRFCRPGENSQEALFRSHEPSRGGSRGAGEEGKADRGLTLEGLGRVPWTEGGGSRQGSLLTFRGHISLS